MADEETPETNSEEETPPNYLFGIQLLVPIHGMGVELRILEGPEYIRVATLMDQSMIAGHYFQHTQAVMASLQFREQFKAMISQERAMSNLPRNLKRH